MTGQAKILSAGGNSESSRALGELSFRSGYDLRQCESDAAALTAISAEPPDLIIIDLAMPGALALCRRISSEHHSRRIPVVIMSSSTNAVDLVEGLRAGASDFIATPFQPEELLLRVNMHLKRGSGHAEQDKKAQPGGHKQRDQTGLALRESETRFRDMANSAPLMIVASGPDKRATFFNKRWLEFRGRTLNQELGWGWTEGLHPDDRQECLAHYSRSFEARRDCHLEYRLLRADGEYRSILCSGVPRYGAGGAFIGYIGSCVDVTDLRRSERERQKLQEEDLTLFAAGVAHDFNNLLAAALAEMDLVLPELAFDAPARRHIQSIERILSRASDVVDLLISYSATGNPPALDAISLSALVEDVIHLMEGVLSQKRVRVISRLASNLPPILANGPQIRRVVMNLITNAIEALDSAAGSITVSTSLAHLGPDQEKAPGLKEGDYISLSLADTGHGMTGETLARALDPFFTTKPKGRRGLGLAVVHGIVRSHRGAVRASSGSGQGATFEVLLPCATAPHIESACAAPNTGHEVAHQNSLQNGLMTVLLIEDEHMLRSATGTALEDRGFRVLYARDGEEALEKLRDTTRRIDAVVLDLTLPDMSGLEVVTRIARLRPDARIIMTSGHYLDSHNLEAIAGNGKRFFLRKPYRLSELVQTILTQVPPSSSTEVPGAHTEPLH